MLGVSRWILAALKVAHPTAAFRFIYRHRMWGSESASGPGSTLFGTRVIREALPTIIERFGVRSIADVPCGDWHWMQQVDLSKVDYTGGDLVPELVEEIAARFGGPNRQFVTLDLRSSPLPKVDLFLCRDALFHFSNRDACAALANIRASGSRLLLSTTWTDGVQHNRNIRTSRWRRIDLRLPPFNLPEPLETFPELHPTEPARAMCLWRLAGS